MSKVKEKTRESFLETAKEVFMEKGIAESFMEEIATRSGKTRRTIYRYFDCKEELAYEVLLDILTQWNTFHKDTYSELSGNGLKKLGDFLHQLKTFMNERRDLMSFMAEFDFYFKDSDGLKVSEDLLQKFEEVSLESDQLIKKLIEDGISDGSIKLEKELHLVVSTISSVLWGYGQRVAIRGNMIEKELHIEPIEIISCQIDMYLKYLEA
jgi:AcrR family transcriptional regulator